MNQFSFGCLSRSLRFGFILINNFSSWRKLKLLNSRWVNWQKLRAVPTPTTCVHPPSWPHGSQPWSHRVSNRPRVLDMCTHSCCFLNACLTPVLPLSCSPLWSRQINDSAGEACRCIVLYAGHVIVDRLSSIWRPGWHPHDSVSDLTCLLCFYEHKPCKLHGCTHSALKSLQPPSADPPSTCQASLKRH